MRHALLVFATGAALAVTSATGHAAILQTTGAATGNNVTGPVDLTAGGTLDYVHFVSGNTEVHKAAATVSITLPTASTASTTKTVGYSWTDGTLVSSGTDDKYSPYGGGGEANQLRFEVDAPADTATRTLKVYFGSYYGATAQAWLASEPTNKTTLYSYNIGNGHSENTTFVQYDYSSAAPDDKIIVQLLSTGNGGWSSVDFAAATLSGSAVPEPATLGMLALGGLGLLTRRWR